MSESGVNPLALRVLNGTARGAEVELRSRTSYTIGIDDDADLIIDDAGIAGRHAVVEVEGTVVRVSPLSPAEVFLEGEPFEGGVVPLYTAVVLGSTAVAFGEYGASWPRVDIPLDLGGPVEGPVESVSDPEAEVSSEQPVSVKPAGGGRWLWLVLGLAAVFLVLVPSGLGLFETLKLHRIAEEALAAEEDPVVETGLLIEQILRPEEESSRPEGWTSDWSRLVSSRVGNAWQISGYVESRSQIASVMRACAEKFDASLEQNSPIIWRINSVSDLQSGLEEVLKRVGVDGKAVYLENGEFAIEGSHADTAQWDDHWSQLATIVDREIPSIRQLRDRMTVEPGSAVPRSSEPRLRSSEPVSPSIPLAIRSISLGRSNCVTLVSGERLFEGAELPSGHRLESIEPGRLIVSQAGQRMQLIINPGLIDSTESTER